MPSYRRSLCRGGSYFFTVVTKCRQPFLCDEDARQLLRDAIAACRRRTPFAIEAFVLLPDHLHTIWTLPDGDADFPRRWSAIKKSFAQAWCARGGWEGPVTASHRRLRRRGVWQPRYWEHLLRDEQDRDHHLDYIHYNPVKHGYVRCPHLWPWSSFQRLVVRGVYAADWSCCCDGRVVAPPDFSALDVGSIENPFGE